jgi:hypothetical protein
VNRGASAAFNPNPFAILLGPINYLRTRGQLLVFKPVKSYKKECQEKNLPIGSKPIIFSLGIQPNCLNVHSYSESGLGRVKGFALSPRVKRSFICSSLQFHFAVVTAPVVF